MLRAMAHAQVVLPCPSADALAAAQTFFCDRLGFRIAAVFPADAPRVLELEGHGLALRLECGIAGDPGSLRLACESIAERTTLVAPNGTRVELVPLDLPVVLPPLVPERVLARAAG